MISTRALRRPELDKAVALARELRASGVAVTLVVHEHKRLGRGIELATLAEALRAADIGLQFLTGELQGRHDPSGVVFTVLAALSGMEREYIRDRTLEGHESARARARGKAIGGAAVTDDAMLSHALHLRDQQHLSLRDIAARLVITTGKKRGRHPSPATVLRMLRDHDDQTGGQGPGLADAATEPVTATGRPERAPLPRRPVRARVTTSGADTDTEVGAVIAAVPDPASVIVTVRQYQVLRTGERADDWVNIGPAAARELLAAGLITVWQPDIDNNHGAVGMKLTTAGHAAIAAYRRAHRHRDDNHAVPETLHLVPQPAAT